MEKLKTDQQYVPTYLEVLAFYFLWAVAALFIFSLWLGVGLGMFKGMLVAIFAAETVLAGSLGLFAFLLYLLVGVGGLAAIGFYGILLSFIGLWKIVFDHESDAGKAAVNLYIDFRSGIVRLRRSAREATDGRPDGRPNATKDEL